MPLDMPSAFDIFGRAFDVFVHALGACGCAFSAFGHALDTFCARLGHV